MHGKVPLIITMVLTSALVSGQSGFNKQLAAALDSMYDTDQAGRLRLDSLQKKYGWQSEQVQSLLPSLKSQDSLNVIRVKKIIDNYGWQGPDQVGKKGSQTIFLVIQHADSLTQVTYFPVMRAAVKEGKALPRELALLEDRILTTQGKEQVYGSQVRMTDSGKFEFFPINDEPNVNKRRAAVGLDPLEDYAKHFDIIYVLPKAGVQKN